MKAKMKGRASAKYLAVKGTLLRKLESVERQVAKLDARVSARARKRGNQVADSLERAAAQLRRAVAK